ncbi:hypothetical protein [Pseudoxanthomonas suwonensis]|uniref:hypothetical protein n=1 Tax=Pseudoxanthomonas suwonensis TaxID=314722 RepID=UPI0004B5EEBB|nr:hypothetical protein [Pseudoxanthomonas suwonensis]
MASVDWFPIVFIVFKLGVLGVGMFFAIKWHHDKDKQARAARSATRDGQPPEPRS